MEQVLLGPRNITEWGGHAVVIGMCGHGSSMRLGGCGLPGLFLSASDAASHFHYCKYILHNVFFFLQVQQLGNHYVFLLVLCPLNHLFKIEIKIKTPTKK